MQNLAQKTLARSEMLGNISLEILKLARSLEMSVAWEGHYGTGKLRTKNWRGTSSVLQFVFLSLVAGDSHHPPSYPSIKNRIPMLTVAEQMGSKTMTQWVWDWELQSVKSEVFYPAPLKLFTPLLVLVLCTLNKEWH